MKILTRLGYFLIVLLTIVFFTNCERTIFEDTIPDIATPSTLEFIQDTSGIGNDLRIISNLLSDFGFEEKLMGSGPYTFWAPSDEAFDLLIAENPDWTSLSDIPTTTLQEILDYHFVNNKNVILRDTFIGFVNSSRNTDFDAFASILVKSEGSIRINGERNVALQDVRTTNGIIQVLDEVMLPPTVFDLIEADSRLSTLTELLERDDFSTNFIEVLNGDGPFTIFAPTDTAFTEYLLAESISSINVIPTADLEKILLNHVSITNNLRATDLSTIGMKVKTLNNTELEVVAIAGNNSLGISGSNEPAKYIENDGQGVNGVIHLVNNILLP